MKTADYSTPFYGGFTESDLAAWRYVRDQGGYWTGPELSTAQPALGSPVKVAYRLKRLHSAGHMACIPKHTGGRHRYGVTSSCTAPQGEQLQPIFPPTNGTNQSSEDRMNKDTSESPAAGEQTSISNAMARLGLAQGSLAMLTHEQLSQQVDLTQRLLGMAINGTPAVDRQAFPSAGIDLALHALLTAYMSLADGYELHTQQAAYMAAQASVGLDYIHNTRALRSPARVQ